MQLKDQVSNFIQSEWLVKMGLYRPSLFVHFKADNHSGIVLSENYVRNVWNVTGCAYEISDIRIFPAYTVAELGEMIPTLGFEFVKSNNGKGKDFFWLSSEYWRIRSVRFENEFEAYARAEMIIYLLESGNLRLDDLNKKLAV